MSDPRQPARFVRRLALTGAVALLVAAPAVAAAGSSAEHGVSDLPAALVDALHRDLNLSANEYLDRSAAAARLAAFQRAHGDEVSGAWLDANGTPVVATRSAQTIAAAQAAGLTIGDPANMPAQVSVPTATATAAPDDKPVDEKAGGDLYVVPGTEDSYFKCSVGFNAVGRTGPVVITAGHCDPNAAAAGTAAAAKVVDPATGDVVGAFDRSVFGGDDWAVVAIDPAAAAGFSTNYVRQQGVTPVRIDGIAEPVVGMPVCKSGSTTGFSCGLVTAVGQTVTVSGVTIENMFVTSLCTLPGDSGGAVISGTKALGITSASNVADYDNCKLAGTTAPQQGRDPHLIATPITTVLDSNPGLRIRTS